MRQARAAYCVKSEILQFLAPFSACILQPWLQAILFVAGVYLMVNAAVTDARFTGYGTVHFSAFRLLGVEIQGNGSLTFELLRRGCSIAAIPVLFIDSRNASSSLELSLSETTAVDGFSLKSSQGSNLSVSSQGNIRLEGSNDQRSWTLAGSSNFRLSATGPRFLSGAAPLPSALRFDFRAPWPLFADAVVTDILFALACWATAACGAHARLRAGGRERLHSTVFLLWCALLALLSLVVGVGYLTVGLPRESVPPLADCTVYCLLAAALAAAEARFFDAMLAAAAYTLCARALTDCGLFGDCGNLAAQPPLRPLLFAAVGLVFAGLRRRYLRRVVASVRGDYEQLEADWRRAAAAAAPTGALQRLADDVDALAAGCHPALARQLNRRHPGAPSVDRLTASFSTNLEPARGDADARLGSGVGGAALAALLSGLRAAGLARRRAAWPPGPPAGASAPGSWEAAPVDPGSPVTSLDQLYAQACRGGGAVGGGGLQGVWAASGGADAGVWVGFGVGGWVGGWGKAWCEGPPPCVPADPRRRSR